MACVSEVGHQYIAGQFNGHRLSISTPNRFQLDQPLPSEVLSRAASGLMSYRNYPVFSRTWLFRRSLLFGVIMGLFFLLTLVSMLLLTSDWVLAALMGLMTFVAFMVMACAGPAIATWVRHQRWPARRERIGVVLGLAAGILFSYAIDAQVSGRIEKEFIGPRFKAAGFINEDLDRAKLQENPLAKALNFVFLAGIYGLLGGGLALREYFGERARWDEARREDELRALRQSQQETELRLGVLQAQIEPHFLFNTLASLRALVRQDPERAEATIDAFVDHLRATIPKMREGSSELESTLAQQFEICRSYLALMQVRLGSRLRYEIELPEDLRSHPFPPLMLISLVENAIKHGLEPNQGAGVVVLRALKTESLDLRVEVLDDGSGLKPGAAGGIGLSNIRAQLRARFEDRAQMDIQGRAEGGTVASIVVPGLRA